MPKIKFTYTSEYGLNVCERPKPAKEFIPEWFQKMPPYHNSDKMVVENGTANKTFKKCIPLLDGMLSGYIIPLWSDIQVTQTSEGPRITWRPKENVFEVHSPASQSVPAPLGYDQIVFKYDPKLIIQTSPGYSTLILPPSGFQDLPFKQIPAVIDTDKQISEYAFPVWIKSGLEGIIEKGTPMVQVIPFKRESWTHEFGYIPDKTAFYNLEKYLRANLINNYVKNNWTKKEFN